MPKTWEEGWWIVQMTVFPLAAIMFIMATISWAEEASRPEVGSSQNSKAGSVNNCGRKCEQIVRRFVILLSPQLRKLDVSSRLRTILYFHPQTLFLYCNIRKDAIFLRFCGSSVRGLRWIPFGPVSNATGDKLTINLLYIRCFRWYHNIHVLQDG